MYVRNSHPSCGDDHQTKLLLLRIYNSRTISRNDIRHFVRSKELCRQTIKKRRREIMSFVCFVHCEGLIILTKCVLINPIAMYPINPFVDVVTCEIILLHKTMKKLIKTVQCPRYQFLSIFFFV